MDMLLHLLLMSLIVMLTAAVLPGTHINGFWSSVGVAIVIALLNFFLLPFMIIITLPITIVTIGLFLFVLNALVVWMAAALVKGFYVRNFGWALLFALVLSFFHWLFGISGPHYALNTNFF